MEALAAALKRSGLPCELRETDGEAAEGDVVVVDSYRWRADDARAFDGRVVVGIDDLERDLAVHIVVDPSPGAVARRSGRAGLALAGSEYALVDAALADLATKPLAQHVERILVTMGGTGHDLAVDLAGEIRDAMPDLVVAVAAAGEPADERLEHLIPIDRTDGLAPELAVADLVVTAGGVTLLESLCLGRPTVAVVIAENQRRPVAGAARLGAVVEATTADVVAVTAALVGDGERRRVLGQRASDLVDGHGSDRVAAVVCDRLAS